MKGYVASFVLLGAGVRTDERKVPGMLVGGQRRHRLEVL